MATAIAGSVTFNPETDSIKTPDGGSFKFEAPFGKELPSKGFDAGEDTFQVGTRTQRPAWHAALWFWYRVLM